jgi:hypothetical protein
MGSFDLKLPLTPLKMIWDINPFYTCLDNQCSKHLNYLWFYYEKAFAIIVIGPDNALLGGQFPYYEGNARLL